MINISIVEFAQITDYGTNLKVLTSPESFGIV